MARETEDSLQQFAFSGIQVIDPKIFPLLPSEPVFSIIHSYLELAGTHEIKGVLHDDSLWMDLGKIPQIEEAKRMLKR